MDAGLLTLLSAFAFALGACVASFLNVVIWRVPRGESIVSPPSHCPKCGAAIRWFQNVPVVSWLALRGRCASCRAPISPRYVVVEALGGVLFLAVFLRYGTLWRFGAEGLFVIAVMWTWTALMIAGSFIDFDHKLLPDFTTVGGMALGLFCAMAHVFAFGRPWGYVTWSAIGLVFGFGLLWLCGSLGRRRSAARRWGSGTSSLWARSARCAGRWRCWRRSSCPRRSAPSSASSPPPRRSRAAEGSSRFHSGRTSALDASSGCSAALS